MLASGAEGPADVLGAHICTGEARCFFSCILLFTAKFIDPGLFLHGVAVGLERRGQQVYHLVNGGAVFLQEFVKWNCSIWCVFITSLWLNVTL